MKTPRHGMGFRQLPDSRDDTYPLSALMAMRPGPKRIPVSKVWRPGPVMDQGQTSECVGYGCRFLLAAEPVVWPTSITASKLYTMARGLDEFDDEATKGTSVRAGLQALELLGFISAYYWARDVEQVAEYILTRGPVIVGTDWLTGMNEVDAKGFARATGRNTGGHCYVGHRCNFKEEWIGWQNSWGKGYGIRGQFKMSFADFDKLLKRGGVAAAVQEKIS